MMDFDGIPTLGSVQAELGYFASTTEAGRLNTVLNDAYNYVYELETEVKRLRAFADHLAEAADIDRVRLMSRIIALETGGY
jgi:hypothetical protein